MRDVSRVTFAGFLLIGMIVLTLGISAQNAPSPDAKLKNPLPATPDNIAAGQMIYQKYCQFCHGKEAKGDGTMAPKGTHPANLTDQAWQTKSTDGEIFDAIKNGVPPKFDMKGFKGRLHDEDMWKAVDYLRSIKGK